MLAVWLGLLIVAVPILRKLLVAGQTCPKTDMRGKNVVITGGNAGIGVETALGLVNMGAYVIIACRDSQRGNSAVDSINARRSKDAEGKAVFMKLDLCSKKSIHEFVDAFTRLNIPLHVLINNAGVLFCEEGSKTEDGFGMVVGVNHLGHFLLTTLLVPVMKKSAPARIVVLSSVMNTYGKIDLDNLFGDDSSRSRQMQTYNNSKLMNIIFANELQRRLAGTGITVNSVHPGIVVTSIARNLPWIIYFLYTHLVSFFAKSPWEGAQTSLFCATSPKLEGVGGKFYSDSRETKPSELTFDQALATKLWAKSEALLGLPPTLSS